METNRGSAHGRAGNANDPVPPEEPFAYIKTNPGFSMRSPVGLTLMYTGIALFGVWLVVNSLLEYPRQQDGWLLVLAFLGLVNIGLGGWFMYVGIRRWRWKREYERVMGRSPW